MERMIVLARTRWDCTRRKYKGRLPRSAEFLYRYEQLLGTRLREHQIVCLPGWMENPYYTPRLLHELRLRTVA